MKIIRKILFFIFLTLSAPACLVAADSAPTPKAVALINALGCKGCHTIQKEGGSQAPDLTQIGSRMTAAQIYQTLAEQSTKRQKFMPVFDSVAPEDLRRISNYLYQLR